MVRNIPAIGVLDELRAKLSLFGSILDFRVLDSPEDRDRALGVKEGEEKEDDRFMDMVWVQYETVNNARHAKARAGLKPFYGSLLKVSYAPQDESPSDTAQKMKARRELLLRRARRAGNSGAQKRVTREQNTGAQREEHDNYARLLPPADKRRRV